MLLLLLLLLFAVFVLLRSQVQSSRFYGFVHWGMDTSNFQEGNMDDQSYGFPMAGILLFVVPMIFAERHQADPNRPVPVVT